MSDYTPTTPVIRGAYVQLNSGASWESKQPRLAEFDRWLEQVKAEAWDEGYSASETTWKHIYDGHPVPEGEMCPECSTGNPYRQKEQDR